MFTCLLAFLSRLAALPSPSVVIMQTHDGELYEPFFSVTQPANKKYAKKHGYDYWSFVGVIRGQKPWHAAFNRLYMLEMAVQAKQYDWAFYLDNDALIVDHTLNLDVHLKQHCLIVAAMGGTEAFFDINDGVMLINLRHPKVVFAIKEWRHMYERISTKSLANEPDGSFRKYGAEKYDDQGMLHAVIRQHVHPDSMCVQKGSSVTLNYNGSFVRHVLRGDARSVQDRLQELKEVAAGLI